MRSTKQSSQIDDCLGRDLTLRGLRDKGQYPARWSPRSMRCAGCSRASKGTVLLRHDSSGLWTLVWLHHAHLTDKSVDATQEGGAMAERARVLVTYASRMGSTQEIAETIGREGRSLCGQRV